jgi:hypothetical protein
MDFLSKTRLAADLLGVFLKLILGSCFRLDWNVFDQPWLLGMFVGHKFLVVSWPVVERRDGVKWISTAGFPVPRVHLVRQPRRRQVVSSYIKPTWKPYPGTFVAPPVAAANVAVL